MLGGQLLPVARRFLLLLRAVPRRFLLPVMLLLIARRFLLLFRLLLIARRLLLWRLLGPVGGGCCWGL